MIARFASAVLIAAPPRYVVTSSVSPIGVRRRLVRRNISSSSRSSVNIVEAPVVAGIDARPVCVRITFLRLQGGMQ